MVTAARTLLDGSPERVWSAFDPINGYAQPWLDIARDGCRGAWFTPSP